MSHMCNKAISYIHCFKEIIAIQVIFLSPIYTGSVLDQSHRSEDGTTSYLELCSLVSSTLTDRYSQCVVYLCVCVCVWCACVCMEDLCTKLLLLRLVVVC